MYSVLILNRKTCDSLNLHYPLFLEALDKQQIGLCRWNEAGTTIETALPELVEKTDDKKEWRAIIVHVEDESAMAEFERSESNPFDFLINKNGIDDEVVKDSPIPLIKLSYMLAGVPAPIKKFEPKLIDEKKPPQIVFEIDKELEKKKDQTYKLLADEYAFNGKKPTEIVFITLREQNEFIEAMADKAWRNVGENSSSDFWKRNRYPSDCRFIVFETTNQGRVENAAEMFRFWSSVLIVALNEIESSFLQAYRLYKMDLGLDMAKLYETIQSFANALSGIQRSINESIKIDIREQLKDEGSLPIYDVEIPVEFDFSRRTAKGTKVKSHAKSFKLAANTIQGELNIWDGIRREAEQEIKDVYKTADRRLSQSAERLHKATDHFEHAVVSLDKYEIMDFEKELEDTYSNVMQVLEGLPKGALYDDADLIKASKNVKDTILRRITKSQVLWGLFGSTILLLLTFIPAFIYLDSHPNGSVSVILLGVAFGAAILFFGAIMVLCIRRIELKNAITRYISKLRSSINALFNSAKAFSQYFSGIATHINGSLYLKSFTQKGSFDKQLTEARNNHMTESKKLTEKLKLWSEAFHLKVNFEEDALGDNVDIDPYFPPRINPIYSFPGYNPENKVMFNIPDNYINSPFPFINEFNMRREELYNDD